MKAIQILLVALTTLSSGWVGSPLAQMPPSGAAVTPPAITVKPPSIPGVRKWACPDLSLLQVCRAPRVRPHLW